jgi:hypothetical protein
LVIQEYRLAERDLEFNTVLNKIYVATFGRGIWESDLSAITGISNAVSNEKGIELYPSPNDGSFTLSFPEEILNEDHMSLEIIDVMGRKVHSSALAGQTNYKFKLDLAPGLYFAKVKGKNYSGVKSFTVK